MRGTFPMSVDSKARVTLPADFRRELGREVTLVPYLGRVLGFARDDFEAWVASFFERDGGYDARNLEHERLALGLNASSVDLELDSAGRLALGKLDGTMPVREQMGLTGEVVVVGNGSRFEIWSRQAWDEHNKQFQQDLSALIFGNGS